VAVRVEQDVPCPRAHADLLVRNQYNMASPSLC
jgi:hypothetical protein